VNELKNEFIRAIMISLKIENNPFIVSTIDEYVKDIKPTEYKNFMSELFGTQHSYLNGLDRVSKVAEKFKPIIVDDIEAKAIELIELVYSMYNTVFENAKMSGRTFEDELKGTKFLNIDVEDIAIISTIKQHYGLKSIIANIGIGWNGKEQINAFKSAIKLSGSNGYAIENKKVMNMIGGVK